MYYILSTLTMGTCNVVKIVKMALLVHLLVQLVWYLPDGALRPYSHPR